MEILEITLLIIAYTLIIITLFLEIVCYKRNIETLETIAFTVSLLLLIVSLTVTHFFTILQTSGSANVFILFAMVLTGLTTPLNVLEERLHKIRPVFRKFLIIFSGGLLVLIMLGHLIQILDLLQYVVAIFLGASVIFSMILIRTTKPRVKIAHREKMQRNITIAVLIFIPLSLIANFVTDLNGVATKIGFVLPMIFILLAGGKLWDDVHRLSLIKPQNTVREQNLVNYSLTKREKEIALLLVKGNTYRQISEQLFISMPTVKTHVGNIYKKCKANNRIELISLLSI
ncbi:LuxR C-terminal-related transcriptional regulator [Fulvivirgaceae bacterium BMA10]|uniref:LuxR C-terminal-related transcriptional regulator n=1 Tax=Splendidivirga corallicola TaxID=3051826 RepID=A0ABT8KPW3_9BACT|nr:LuxR C-terminal-related transcriptional regulator [Fulvivirgaceae bacterium BMA10]